MINRTQSNVVSIEVLNMAEECSDFGNSTQISDSDRQTEQVDEAIIGDFVASVATNLDLSTPKNSMAHSGWGVCYSD